eukprot:scaffold1867_cov247-Pinguiococcus_pyrenoidosus.AAC.26
MNPIRCGAGSECGQPATHRAAAAVRVRQACRLAGAGGSEQEEWAVQLHFRKLKRTRTLAQPKRPRVQCHSHRLAPGLSACFALLRAAPRDRTRGEESTDFRAVACGARAFVVEFFRSPSERRAPAAGAAAASEQPGRVCLGCGMVYHPAFREQQFSSSARR